ncbi:DUF2971 domain-containing protein [Pseudomonas aeruginosa]
MDSKRTESIITDGKVWLAKPSTLNDPLECQIKPLTPESLREHTLKVKHNQATGFVWAASMARENGASFYGLDSKQIKYLLKRIRFTKGFNAKYKFICDFQKSIDAPGFSNPEGYIRSLAKHLSEVGVFSLSEDPVNTLMWSHYGENHQGLAFGFNPVEGSDLASAEMCKGVSYTDELSEFSFMDGYTASLDIYGDGELESKISFEDKQIQRAIFTKTSHWAYEKEWRYVQQTEGAYDLPAPITEIIFGKNCPSETREKYRDLAQHAFGDSVKFRETFYPPGSISLDLRDC